MIRLVAVDIDGTITSSDRKLNLPAIEAVRELEGKGIPVVLSTGNILQFAEAAAVMIGTSGPIIAEDGGIVYDQVKRVEYLLGERGDADRGLMIIREKLGTVNETRNSRFRLAGLTIERTVPVEDVRAALGTSGLNLIAVDSGFAIHLKSPDVNKGKALLRVSEIMGMSLEDIAAVGDGPNDVEMLRTAGLSFALSNSPDEVKRASKRVTKNPNGLGFIEAAVEILRINGCEPEKLFKYI